MRLSSHNFLYPSFWNFPFFSPLRKRKYILTFSFTSFQNSNDLIICGSPHNSKKQNMNWLWTLQFYFKIFNFSILLFWHFATLSVVVSETENKRGWETSTSKNRPLSTDRKRTILRKGYPFPMLTIQFSFRQTTKGRERNGKETNYQRRSNRRKNPLYQELPKREVVIKSGKTL